MKRLYLIVILLSLVHCQINGDNSEKEKENKKNEVKCLLVSLVIFRQILPVNLKDDEAVVDSATKAIATDHICIDYLNKKDGVD